MILSMHFSVNFSFVVLFLSQHCIISRLFFFNLLICSFLLLIGFPSAQIRISRRFFLLFLCSLCCFRIISFQNQTRSGLSPISFFDLIFLSFTSLLARSFILFRSIRFSIFCTTFFFFHLSHLIGCLRPSHRQLWQFQFKIEC